MMDAAHDPKLDQLPPARGVLAGVFARPKLVAIVCVIALTALGWIYLGMLVADMIAAGHAGGVMQMLRGEGGADALGRALVTALCRPTFGTVPGAAAAFSLVDLLLVLSMWCAMALAMMLPSAGPMILAYAEIAAEAARRREPVVSPLVLAAGYLSVWLGFALAAAMLQTALGLAGLVDPTMATVSPLFAGAIFIGAAVYQFSPLKYACVTACQRPSPFFVSRWTSAPAGVFRLGVQQGLFCLGCCWAMMLVMFAVGVMNVVWMAALGLVMAAEKIATTTRLSKVIGIVLGVIGMSFIAAAMVAHWPA